MADSITIDSITGAHVADALEQIDDIDSDYGNDTSYEAFADEAAALLRRVPALAETVAQWNDMRITWDALVAEVRRVRESDADEPGSDAGAALREFAATQPNDNYVYRLACGHEYDSPFRRSDGVFVTCSAHGQVRVVDGPFRGEQA
jgi:hypothetical protein